MRLFLKNSGYFIKEAYGLFRLNLLTNVLSLVSTMLIFTVLSLGIAGWWISNEVVDVLEGQAMTSIYLDEGTEMELDAILEEISSVIGVRDAQYISAEMAYTRMEEVLGEGAKVLTLYDENPFQAFVEVAIDTQYLELTLAALDNMEAVTTVRDNRAVLTRLKEISSVLNLLSYLVLTSVGFTTFIIMSHIIRQGIYHHREQINTLILLGASKAFIATPFFVQGVGLTLVGGLMSIVMTYGALSSLYPMLAGPLPFIPLPDLTSVMNNITITMIFLSLLLGFAGSMLGMKSLKSVSGA